MIEKIKNRVKNDILLRNIIIAISVILIIISLVIVLLSVFTRHGEKFEVPNFRNMTISKAQEKAIDLELNLEVIDSVYVAHMAKGVILEQYPKPGNYVKSKRRIFLTVNTFSPKIIPMPYVAGFSLRQAKNKLIGAGFTIERLVYVNDIATNHVLGQVYNKKEVRVNSNLKAEIGTGVTLKIGLNPVDVDPVIPGIIGLTVDQAKNRLWEYGFNVGEINLEDDINYETIGEAKVYFQSIPKSTRAMYGRTVSLKATLDKEKVSKGVINSEKESQLILRKEQIIQDSIEFAE